MSSFNAIFWHFLIFDIYVQVVEGTSTGTLARMVSQPGGILAGVAKKVGFCCFHILMV